MKRVDHSMVGSRVGMELDLKYVTLCYSSNSGISDWELSIGG